MPYIIIQSHAWLCKRLWKSLYFCCSPHFLGNIDGSNSIARPVDCEMMWLPWDNILWFPDDRAHSTSANNHACYICLDCFCGIHLSHICFGYLCGHDYISFWYENTVFWKPGRWYQCLFTKYKQIWYMLVNFEQPFMRYTNHRNYDFFYFGCPN